MDVRLTACENFESLIVRAADDLLNASDQSELDQHLATCASCRASLAAQRQIRAILLARTPVNASADFADRVRSAIGTGLPWLAHWDFRRWTWRLAPVAAALSIGVAALMLRASAPPAQLTDDRSAVASTSSSDLPV